MARTSYSPINVLASRERQRPEWSIKRLHRVIVTSATYRQSSRVTPELLRRDADNRLLARGPRVRLEAEVIRDLSLAASGLLATPIGGPSVRPPQPAAKSPRRPGPFPISPGFIVRIHR